MKSATIAKSRILEAITAVHDNQGVKDGNDGVSKPLRWDDPKNDATYCSFVDTHCNQLAELAAKEAAIKGLVEENAMLEKRTITIQQGKQDEIDGWRGKLAKANIELDRLRRNEHNRNAFAEAGK